jgi:hypothetical protein
MKTLYVTIWEFGALQEATDRFRGTWGGFKTPRLAVYEAMREVLGADVAERCLGGVRIEVVAGGVDIKPSDRIR